MIEQELKPLLSVVVPVYNVKEYLERCIESLRASTYTNLQIILVDDGSTDGSGEICDRFAREDPRIQVIHKPNDGLSGARNAGIAQARGQYIAFVDSDDYVHHQMYEVMIHQMQLHDADIADCGFLKPVQTLEDEPYQGCSVTVVNRNEALISLMRWEHFQITVWNKVFKREMVEGILFPPGRIHEDEFWTYQVFFRAKKLLHLDAGLYYYQQSRSGSIMNMSYTEKNYDSTDALFQRVAFMEQHAPELAEEARISILSHVFNRMLYLSTLDQRPVKERKPYFNHFVKLLNELPQSYIAPYCSMSMRKRVKVIGCRVLGRISAGLLFKLFGLSQRIFRRKEMQLLMGFYDERIVFG